MTIPNFIEEDILNGKERKVMNCPICDKEMIFVKEFTKEVLTLNGLKEWIFKDHYECKKCRITSNQKFGNAELKRLRKENKFRRS